MNKQEAVVLLTDLRSGVAHCGKEEVDDPEDVLNDLAMNSARYVEALDLCLEILKSDTKEN